MLCVSSSATISATPRGVYREAEAIIAQGIITGERGTDGHVLTIEGRPRDRTLTVQLALSIASRTGFR